MVTGVACGLQNRHGAFTRLGWVRFPHVPAIFVVVGIAALLGGSATSLSAQDPVPSDSTALERPAAPSAQAAARPDTVPPVSPLGALARSLVLPGWGQTAVGRPARGAVYFGAETAALFMVFKSHAKLTAARRALPVNDELVEARTGDRENWIVLAGFIAFLSALDAWVSANFWDFEPSVRPPEGGDGLSLALQFPLQFP